ncbi:uncharacterized protein [Atheta coriaria]|uniref:uncharacterized protein n=1 Tax=Dalotia coriaria TaxID=877792 RepID=UPI0031F3DA56
MSSNVSDSDASSVMLATKTEVQDKSDTKELNLNLLETGKIPVKKRGGWPKGRKRKPELLHLPPKAPSTGYNLYLNEQRLLFKKSSLPFHEITKLIGNKWSSLRLEEKKPYLERAEEEKKRYREELREYRQSSAYQLYLANKRRNRAKYNVLSESDMDATDDLDEEDNEELYCRTCDQYFHNLHNKREHLQGRQHMQMLAGAIHSDSFSTSLDESSLDCVTASKTEKKPPSDASECMNLLIAAVSKRETDIKLLQRAIKDKNTLNTALYQQLSLLKDREAKMKKELQLLKEHDKDMKQAVINLWQVPSWFVNNDGNNIGNLIQNMN